MRGFAYFLAYVVGVSAVISIFIVSLMALGSSIQQTPSAPILAGTLNRPPVVPAVKQGKVSHKKEHTQQKYRTTRLVHERTREPTAVDGHEAYGYAVEPRHMDRNLFSIFGQTRMTRAMR